MRSRYSFYLYFLFVPAVFGCSGVPSSKNEDVITVAEAPQIQVKEIVAPAVDEKRPPRPRPTGLTPDLVYAVLVGQVATQRGEDRVAFTHFLDGALLGRDPELAELAARTALMLDDASFDSGSLRVFNHSSHPNRPMQTDT